MYDSITQVWCVSEMSSLSEWIHKFSSDKLFLIKTQLVDYDNFPEEKRQIAYASKNEYHSSVVTSLLRAKLWCND